MRLLALIVIALIPTNAYAGCGAIRDADTRDACLARERSQSGNFGTARSYADSISDPNRRKLEQALIDKRRGNTGTARQKCSAISDADQRNFCRSQVD